MFFVAYVLIVGEYWSVGGLMLICYLDSIPNNIDDAVDCMQGVKQLKTCLREIEVFEYCLCDDT